MAESPSAANPFNERLACVTAALAAIFAVVAYQRWPYHYYETFRWCIAISSVITAYLLRRSPAVVVGCIAVAVAFNPITPLRMRAYEWRHYDIAAALTMAIVAGYAIRKVAKSRGTPQG